MDPYLIMAAPSVLGLRPTGVELLPDALLAAGLAARLDARRAPAVPVPPYDPRRDPTTGMLNPTGIAAFTRRLADAVTDSLDRGLFPIVLGGDCSIILGNLLALRRRGRYGLLFIDGHADFYQPEANINGEAASSDLALATGRGPAVLTSFDGLHPLVYDSDVAVIGHRDAEEATRYGSQPLPAAMHAYDLATVRARGSGQVARDAVAHLTAPELDGFWIHFDVDALDDEVMPAVDYRQPDGLSLADAERVLRVALSRRAAVGMDVTVFNPKLDPDGHLAQRLVDLLVRALKDDLAAEGVC